MVERKGRLTIADLSRDCPRQNLRKKLNYIKSGCYTPDQTLLTDAEFESFLSGESTEFRIEARAIEAYFINNISAVFLDHLNRNPLAVFRFSEKCFEPANTYYNDIWRTTGTIAIINKANRIGALRNPPSNISFPYRINNMIIDGDFSCADIEDSLMKLSAYCCYKWQQNMSFNQHDKKKTESDTIAFNRLCQFIGLDFGRKLATPAELLSGGFATCFKVMFGLVELIPDLFAKQYGRPISLIEYRNELQRVDLITLIKRLAACNGISFSQLNRVCRGDEKDYMDKAFQLNCFEFGASGLTIRQTALEKAHEEIQKELNQYRIYQNVRATNKSQLANMATTGCPALFTNPDVIKAIWLHVLDYTDRYLIAPPTPAT